ncbi:hypothetical protein [Actinoplanes sp. G11-F43]|uniref:hypothetical protein n=1 Tax=Actinoplanes sp. G11-F43 TaxID=3424130 RepID=UPI003D33139F
MTSRASMAADLALSPSSPTKTFVLEAHTDDPGDYLRRLEGVVGVEESDDAFLLSVRTESGDFWVDQLDPRFWSFHTDMRAEKASAIINRWVSTHRDLDKMWLPSEHLRQAWPGAVPRRVRTDFRGKALLGSGGADTEDLQLQMSGRNAEAFLEFIESSAYASAFSYDGIEMTISDPDFGTAREAVNREGRFAVSGDSFALHTQFVGSVVSRYSKLVRLCEEKAIGWSDFGNGEGGGSFAGGPISLRFSRPITDQPAFLTELFSSRVPFRLWGVPSITPDGTAEVEAVDLHVGQRLRLDIGEQWMRIYLEKGGCGNTVARMVCNLQHRFDAALSMVDPELDDAIGVRDPARL